MVGRYLIAWIGIVILGLVNATIHQAVYARQVSDLAGHQISTLTFAILVGLYTWVLSAFLSLASSRQAIGVGLMWMGLTVVFEFVLGHYVVGDTWGKLLGDYDFLEGRVWGLFILWVGIAPYLVYRIKD